MGSGGMAGDRLPDSTTTGWRYPGTLPPSASVDTETAAAPATGGVSCRYSRPEEPRPGWTGDREATGGGSGAIRTTGDWTPDRVPPLPARGSVLRRAAWEGGEGALGAEACTPLAVELEPPVTLPPVAVPVAPDTGTPVLVVLAPVTMLGAVHGEVPPLPPPTVTPDDTVTPEDTVTPDAPVDGLRAGLSDGAPEARGCGLDTGPTGPPSSVPKSIKTEPTTARAGGAAATAAAEAALAVDPATVG